MKQTRLKFSIIAFRKHIKEEGKKHFATINSFRERQSETHWNSILAIQIVFVIIELIVVPRILCKYSCLTIMNINLTLSHNI